MPIRLVAGVYALYFRDARVDMSLNRYQQQVESVIQFRRQNIEISLWGDSV